MLAGHDHDYQRIRPQNGVQYLVSGGAAKLREAGREDFTIVSESVHHFLDLEAYADRLEVRAIDQDGEVLDSITLPA